MDDDLQNPPEELTKLLMEIEHGNFDLAYGNYEQKKHNRWRNLGAWLVASFYQIVFKSPANPTSFRIIRRELLESIFPYALNFTYIDGLLAWNTQRIGINLVNHKPREHGCTGYSLSKLLNLALNLFTNFSLLPLQMVSLLGVLSSTLGFLGGAYYLLLYISSDIRVPGYASTIVAILMLGGIQLLALGVIGEYLGRLHLNVNKKPQYVVRHMIGNKAAELSRNTVINSDLEK
jgi:undecaprenyl-phosphate 4-deoxy-4-formamido-L-arabinose transferase